MEEQEERLESVSHSDQSQPPSMDAEEEEELPDDVFLEELMDKDEDDIFHFIAEDPPQPEPLEPEPQIGEAGPGPTTASNRGDPNTSNLNRRVLDDNDDSRVQDFDESAGHVIRMSDPLHEAWRKKFGRSDPDVDPDVDTAHAEQSQYAPFASELDWKIAKWVVEDGPGNNAFNRLLNIPGVSSTFVNNIIVLRIPWK